MRQAPRRRGSSTSRRRGRCRDASNDQNQNVSPATSYPCLLRSRAATVLSTPPLMQTRTDFGIYPSSPASGTTQRNSNGSSPALTNWCLSIGATKTKSPGPEIRRGIVGAHATSPGEDVDLVLPGMGVLGTVPAWRDREVTHHEVRRTLLRADEHALLDAANRGRSVVEPRCNCVLLARHDHGCPFYSGETMSGTIISSAVSPPCMPSRRGASGYGCRSPRAPVDMATRSPIRAAVSA